MSSKHISLREKWNEIKSYRKKRKGDSITSKDGQKPKSAPSWQAQPQGTSSHQGIGNNTSMQDAKALKADDLWRRAYERLHLADDTLVQDYEATILEDFKDNVEISQTTDIKSQMSTIVNLQKQKMESKQWTFQWWGKTETVRDLVDGTLKLTQSASSLISLGMTFAPVYVSLPWSAVCALIPFILNDQIQHTMALTGLKDVMRITYDYNIIENAYLSRLEVRSQEKYATAVLPLYTKIMEFQAKAARYFGTNTLKNIGKNVSHIKNINWKDESDALAKMDRETRETLDFLNHEAQQEDFQTLKDRLSSANQKLDSMMQQFFSQQDYVRKVAKWLSPISYRQEHIAIRRALGPYSTTSGQWFFDSSQYRDWKSSKNPLLWLRGHIGTGKSTIACMVAEKCMRQPTGRLAFFYCSSNVTKSVKLGEVPHNTSENIIRSILRQLSVSAGARAVPKSVQDAYDPTTDCELEIQDCMSRILEIINSDDETTLIIDALDECVDRDSLLETLEVFRVTSKIRIFLTSRFGVTLPNILATSSRVTIEKQNSKDIDTYLTHEIEERRSGTGMTKDQAKRLQAVLNSRAQGMFLWVRLQLDTVLAKKTPDKQMELKKDIEEQILAMSRSSTDQDEMITEAYNAAYRLALGSGRWRQQSVVTALMWILATYRRLTIQELRSASTTSQDGGFNEVTEEQLLRWCSNFITADSSGSLRFTHPSAQEYLLQKKSEDGTKIFSPPQIHARAALASLSYLMSSDIPRARLRLREFTGRGVHAIRTRNFLSYAVTYWPRHYRYAEKSDKLESLRLAFYNSAVQDNTWSKVLYDPLGPRYTTLLQASRRGEERTVEELVALGASLETKDSIGNIPLHEAAQWGHVLVLDILLDAERGLPSPGIDAQNSYGDTALHEAAFWGWGDIVAAIVAHGAKLDIPNLRRETPLHLAVTQDHPAIVQVLVSLGANVNAQDLYGNSPLHYAALISKPDIIPSLMSRSCNSGLQNNSGNTALHLAIMGNRGSTVRELLRGGARDDVRDDQNRTPLELIAELGYNSLENIILDYSVPAATGPIVETPFSLQTIPEIPCPTCQLHLLLSRTSLGRFNMFRISYTDMLVRASTTESCKFCALILRDLEDQQLTISSSGSPIRLTISLVLNGVDNMSSSKPSMLHVTVDETFSIDFEIYSRDGNTPIGPGRVTGRAIQPDAGSDACFDLVKLWSQECASHETCVLAGERTLPTRLVDLGSDPALIELRLCKTLNLTNVKYLYLSSVLDWNYGPVLTPENEHIYMDSIPLSEAPKRLRDAVTVARRLGLRYLWARQLCVRKSDNNDIDWETGMQGDYILNAFAVLAGATENTFAGGFLNERSLGKPLWAFQQIEDGEGEGVTTGELVHLRRPLAGPKIEISRSALMRSPWTMQEIALSKRMIYYGEEQVYWNCQQHLVCEGSVVPQAPLWHIEGASSPSPARGHGKSNRPAFFYHWYKLIEEYTVRDLTDLEDPMLPIVSIAAIFHPKLSTPYMLGLWQGDLHRGLLWRAATGRSTRFHVEQNAPSWTWAALKTPVCYSMAYGVIPSASPLAAEISTTLFSPMGTGLHPFEQVKVGRLEIYAFSRQISIQQADFSGKCIFDTAELEDDWRVGEEYVAILISEWSPDPSGNYGRWVGLLLHEVQDLSLCDKTDFVRVGLYLGPETTQSLDDWERKSYVVV